MKNYYDILGISIDASLECIKDAYRKLAKKFHPDLNAGDEFFKKHFMSIQEAYEVLSSEAKRKVYDQQFANVDSKTLSEQIDEKILLTESLIVNLKQPAKRMPQRIRLKTVLIA